MKISAKTKAKPTPVVVDYPLPEKLPELVKAYGEEVVASAAKGALVISAQAYMRRMIEKGKTPAEIQGEISKWKPDVRQVVKMSALEKATTSIDKLSPQERAELLKKLQAAK